MAPPAAKRKRRSGGRAAPAPSAAAREKMVQRLSADDARAILAELMGSSPAAVTAVSAELKRQDEAPLDFGEYTRRASEIVYSLEGLRDSQVFMRSGDVTVELADLVAECKQRLTTVRAFQAIVAIVECVEANADGKARRAFFGCGGFEHDTADELAELAEEMDEEEKAEVDDDVNDLEVVVKALDDFGSGYNLAKVVKEFRDD